MLRKLAFILIFAGALRAATNEYYVSSSGSNSNGGSQASPWLTIQHCADNYVLGSSGAICHVISGNYAESTITISRSGTSSARVLYISDTKWGAHLTGRFSVSNGVSYVDIEQFDITGPTTNYSVLLGSGTSRSIQYNYIHDIQTSGSCPLNGVIHETTAPSSGDVINGNRMRHMGNSSCAGGSGYMAIYADGSGIRITNNIISGLTGGWAIQKQYASITDCTPGVISNNTLFNNQGGIVLNDEGNSCHLDHWTITNNIVVNNGISGTGGGSSAFGINYYHMASAPNTLVSNNMVYGNLPANYAIHGSTCTAGTIGCPAVNPKTDAGVTSTFLNFQTDTNASPSSGGDYHLKSGSNAIDGGTTAAASGGLSSPAPSADFVSISRPQGLFIDLGVYEFTGGTVAKPSPPTGLTAIVH